ncbi:hypothetical protein [Nocardia amikacinitolerans]|uniref:hypothetical protein n=1 Tax=Nocardia amikacinitolerans TaxID=756689 RepID=UPI0020A4D4CE|nr:hypothetical protein [Nocardia amikacinitolerans]MCP2280873.1 hypothetical protein [Nocardia amikacinitolerans]
MALPVAAIWLTCPPLAAASPAPPLPPPGIITGSAAGGPSTGIESPPTAAPLALGPKPAHVPRDSGSAGGDAAEPDQPLVPLSLGAGDTSTGGTPIGSGSAAAGAAGSTPRTNSGSALTDLTAIDTGSAYAAIPVALTPEGSPMGESPPVTGAPGYEPVPVADTDSALEPATTTPAETLGLDVGSVRTACTGSAAAGSAALALGSAAPALGSGLIGSGSSGSALSSGLMGPGLLGSGSALGSGTGSGLVGPGSSGSALGSAAGSALGGSALLTCLLLLPTTPPTPGIPLRLEPPLPIPKPQAAPEPVPAQALTPEPVPPPLPARPPEAADPQPVEPTADQLAWNLLELMTVLVITVLAAVRTRVVATRAPRLP